MISFGGVTWTKLPVKKSQIPQNLKLEVTSSAQHLIISSNDYYLMSLENLV